MLIVYLGAIVVPLFVLMWNLARGTQAQGKSARPGRRQRRKEFRASRVPGAVGSPRVTGPVRMAPPEPVLKPVVAVAPQRVTPATPPAPRPTAPTKPSLGARLRAVPGAFSAGFRVAWSELSAPHAHDVTGSAVALTAPVTAPASLSVVRASGAVAIPAPHVPRTPSVPGWVPAPGYAAAPTPSDMPVVFAETVRTCPDCAETVARRAAICRHCGHRFVYGAAGSG